ncbi:MAG TPA: methyltransferase domain-containing protein, partial [candidate division Zixibacteria bacterium]|nr:methyltransferase domain-containing protein [candidate division Zixibacteria bacterium]
RRFRGRPRRDFHRPSVIIIDLPRARETVIVEQFDPGMTFRPPPFLPPAPPERTRLSGELAPFDPVPLEIVERMLALARVRKGDVLYDLGCGDGRVAIAAVKRFGARAVCFETDPGLVKLARENVRREKIEKAVEIREQDFTSADLSRATVVTLYLSREANDALKPLLMKRLRPGSRVVSYRFDMGDWLPKITETYRDSSGETRTLFLWEIGAPLAKNAAD